MLCTIPKAMADFSWSLEDFTFLLCLKDFTFLLCFYPISLKLNRHQQSCFRWQNAWKTPVVEFHF